ncbi:MAG: ATP synthase subunit I [Jaaginema sp. PMC 1079.18]|nr:ATP synthase subunit I [Jaaginema sp. PMC 1080.18]MEC4851294.1 ATP synthase subunit I [Jaaginema sp. PMC 1079.18]MEC4867116.1 ATP synthase subunit I [Jaaginema sp. PMC 1078.18]
MNPPNSPLEAENQASEATEAQPSDANNSMGEYYQLKQTLLLGTLGLAGIIFISVWLTYSLNTALNYLLGACFGLVYLRMLAKEVERLGVQKSRPGSTRLGLLVGLIIVATQWHQLHILPVFLGFLTYKAAIVIYVLQTTLLTPQK